MLTEIIKMDPNFCKELFMKECEKDIIPNILEAMNRGELDILRDWCFESAIAPLCTQIRSDKQMGYIYHNR